MTSWVLNVHGLKSPAKLKLKAEVFHLFPTLCPSSLLLRFPRKKNTSSAEPLLLCAVVQSLLCTKAQLKKKKKGVWKGYEEAKDPRHTITWAEQPEEQSDRGILSKESFFDGWDPFNSNDCVQFKPPQFSHCLQLLFDLPLWTLGQKWFNFLRLDQWHLMQPISFTSRGGELHL